MFITLKSLLHTLLLPPGGPLLVAAAGVWLLRSRSAGAARAGWLLLGERIAYGAFLAHRTALPVLVSGTSAEALAMRVSLAREFGIQVRWVEDRSRDTFQNAQFSSRLLKAAGVSRILLVTDSAHEWRASHEFASAGLTVLPAPVGVWAPRERGLLRCLPAPAAL